MHSFDCFFFYLNSTRMIEIQQKLSERALELLALPDDVPCYLLDIGLVARLCLNSSLMQGSYRLWNSGKTMEFEQKGRRPTYGKTMEFSLWWKKVRAFFKKWGENTSGLRNVVSMFVASVITSLSLALLTSRAIALASAK